MSLPVVLRPAAAADIEQAYGWYEEERPGLGEEFLEVVQSMLAVIATRPERFPIIRRQTRRALLQRFPLRHLLSRDVERNRRCCLLPRKAKPKDLAVTSLMPNPSLERMPAKSAGTAQLDCVRPRSHVPR